MKFCDANLRGVDDASRPAADLTYLSRIGEAVGWIVERGKDVGEGIHHDRFLC